MREKIAFIGMLLLIVALFVISLSFGKVAISMSYIIDVFTGKADEITTNLILNFRIPKSIAAILVGIALPVAGFLMQELFKNPLAEPSVLGVTSMASLGVGVVIFLFSMLGLDAYLNHPWIIIFASLIGSFVALLFVLGFATRIKSSASLVILGFMITGLTGAFIGLMQYVAPSEKIKSFLMWGFGSLSGLTWHQLLAFTLFIVVGLVIALFTLRGISALLLGERYAATMGINVKHLRLLILISTAILTAGATAFTGPIGFVGLVIPHLCRTVLKTGNIVLLFRWIIVLGICSMLFFSILTEAFPFGTLPINIITSLVGAPIVISILLNNKYQIN